MCRLMCHCVRHISLDNKYGRSVEVIHSFPSRWRAGTELCAGTQDEEPYGKKSSMGSESRQRSFRGNLKFSVTRSIAPKRVALENRRYLPERLLFPYSSMQSQRRRKATSTQRVPRPTQSSLGEVTASWRTSETSVSTFGDSRSPSSSSCRTALPVCAGRQSSVPALQRDRDECIVLTDRPYLLSRLI